MSRRYSSESVSSGTIKYASSQKYCASESAGGAGSARGTGGMATKIRAAEIAGRANIPTYILSGEDPENLYRIFDGEDIGTVFMP